MPELGQYFVRERAVCVRAADHKELCPMGRGYGPDGMGKSIILYTARITRNYNSVHGLCCPGNHLLMRSVRFDLVMAI